MKKELEKTQHYYIPNSSRKFIGICQQQLYSCGTENDIK
jgi:hypothetical protein